MSPATLKHDPVTQTIYDNVTAVITDIEEINKTLLADESGTSVRDIDAKLKEEAKKEKSELPADVLKVFASAEAAYKQYREAVEKARNLYRTKVLGEEEKKDTDDVDTTVLRERRKTAMDSLQFIAGYAAQNKLTEVAEWAKSVAVPQIGRQGSSTAEGTKRPRVYVHVDGTVYDSFTKAALALNNKDNPVSAGTLTDAWEKAGGAENFELAGKKKNEAGEVVEHTYKVRVVPKEKKATDKK